MEHVALTAVGADQPGIVAALTGVLVDLGCNLEDSTMSILRGQFAVLLVIVVPEDPGAQAIEAALAPVADRLGLTIVARPLPPGTGAGDSNQSDAETQGPPGMPTARSTPSPSTAPIDPASCTGRRRHLPWRVATSSICRPGWWGRTTNRCTC